MDVFFFFKQKTAYEMRISDWSSDVCSSDLCRTHRRDDAAHLAVRAGLAGLGQLVAAELEHLVARDLRIIGREVARLLALEMMRLGLPVRLDRQMAAAATRRRSEEHTSELQSLMRISYAVFCLKKKKNMIE